MPLLQDLIAGVEPAAPDVAGPLAVFPLFGPAPTLEYLSFAEASARGATVTELPQASVNDLLVFNPLDVGVLLFEGEQLRGARQDRTVDGAVLVPAGAKLSVPVSCVEQSRWEGARHAEPFAPSPDHAHPELRAAKSSHMRAAMAAAAPARAHQGEVWGMVGGGPLKDAFDERVGDIDSLIAGVPRRDGQTGALVAIGRRFTVLDHVSRPDAWAALHGPLVRGYALDALRRPAEGDTASLEDAQAWLASLAQSTLATAPAPGAGERIRTATGTGLVVDGELVQLSVYP
jgi:hypothetical protein